VYSVYSVGRKKFNDHPFAYHQEIELVITTLTNRGLGLGRVKLEAGAGESAAGAGDWVVMVPFTLPGERVRARVFRNQKNFSEADLLEVIRPSPQRVVPQCPLFGRCGGCQYQHLDYAAQLQWKQRQVEELLQHMAGVTFPVAPVVPSPREYGYRSKITPHFAGLRKGSPSTMLRAGKGQGAGIEEQGRGGKEQGGPSTSLGADRGQEVPAIGFLRQGTRFDIVDVPQCPIATPEINARLTEVRADTQRRLAAGEFVRGATLLLRQAEEGVVTDYDAVIHEKVDGLRLHFLARDFFQNNPFILPAFTQYVKREAAGDGARYLVDAYCGSGLFALTAADAFERVEGIEISESSVRFARENAESNGIANAGFRVGTAAAIFGGLIFSSDDTAVVIDPPRRGCDEDFLRQLFAFGPRTVVYVSCDPATQMRDLRGFLESGYELRAVQPFDLFPQTRHLECVMTLARTSP